jgi:hypothetical protein
MKVAEDSIEGKMRPLCGLTGSKTRSHTFHLGDNLFPELDNTFVLFRPINCLYNFVYTEPQPLWADGASLYSFTCRNPQLAEF